MEKISRDMQVIRHKKSEKMEGFIARMYDRNARKFQMGIYEMYLENIKGYLNEGDKILEVAPGPGYLTIELAKSGDFEITGMDISKTFVEIAQCNAARSGVTIRFITGDAADMPFPDKSFNFIVCTAAFKNFRDPVQALKEMYRVLKPDGKVWIADLRKDISREAIDRLVTDQMKAKGFSAKFMKWSFRTFLKKSAYTKEQITPYLESSDFRNFDIKETPTELEILLTR